MEPLRLQLRAVVARTLGLVPTPAVLRLRRAHRLSPPGGVRRRFLSALLGVVRHRHLHSHPDVLAIEELDLLLHNDNSVLTKRLFYFGEYEGAETHWWREYCRRAQDILELGANVGVYTVIGAKAQAAGRYTAFEPHPTCAEVLRRNLSLNGVSSVTVVEAAAVGKAVRAEMELLVPRRDADATPTGGSIAPTAEISKSARARIAVRVVEARPFLERADLVKMDIEGEELEVLQSVEDLLANRRPTIFLELQKRNDALRAYLPGFCRRCGYQVFGIAEHQLQPLDLGETGDHQQAFGTRDIILTAESPS